MSKSIVSQIPNNLLFRYRVPCLELNKKWSKKLELPPEHDVPSFCAFEDGHQFGEIRTAWSDDGLFVWAQVTGKAQSLWCRSTQLLESDGLQIWVDTRDTHNIHRASKFCHWFVIMPAGGGAKKDEPVVNMLKINRAKDHPPTINRAPIQSSSKITKSGYQVSVFIPRGNLYGWDANEQRDIGFYYAFVDRELGWQTMATGPEMPISEDPSLWCTLHLESPIATAK